MSENAYPAAVLAVTQGFAAFTTFAPKLSEVRKVDPSTDPGGVADVRLGELGAIVVTMGTAIIVQ